MIRYLLPLVGSTLLIIILGRLYSDSLRLDPKRNPYMQEVCAEFDRYFLKQMERTGTPGSAVVIVKDSSILYMKGFGVKQIDSQDSIDINTVFRIGSLSKGFASVLTAMLVQDSLLNWQDPVLSFVPNFRLHSYQQTQELTVNHVLSQRTGLPRHAFTNLIEQKIQMDRIYKELRQVELVGKVGKLYSYQNAAYSLITKVVEEASDQPFSHLLHDRIFTPLGMDQSSCSYPGILYCDNKATPHYRRKNTFRKTRINSKYYNAVPAGGINASISDMGEWLKLLVGAREDLIGSEHLESVFQPAIFTNNRNRYFHRWPYLKKAYYGMGWRIIEDGQDTLIYHGGYVNGYRSEIALNRKEGIGICILSNAPSELAPKGMPVFWDVYRIQKRSIHTWQNKRHWAFSLPKPRKKTHMISDFTQKIVASNRIYLQAQ